MGKELARTVLVLAAVFAGLAVGWTAGRVHFAEYHTADLQGIQNAFKQVVGQLAPSVVSIRASRRTQDASGPPGFRMPFENAGSGVIIDHDGHVLTNEHVIHRVRRLEVVLHDGRVLPAEVAGTDPRSDLAVLHVEADDLQPASLGGFDQVRRGHWALAMGNALGLATDGQASFSYGVVSAIGRALPGLGQGQDRYYGNLIQSTAQIHQGNSGGPLLDIRGRVIGINTAMGVTVEQGLSVGFAIPLDPRTLAIIEKLTAGEAVEYGYVGVQVPVSGLADRDEPGALISEVLEGEPAHQAGIRAQDLVLTYDGRAVRDEDHLVRLVGATEVGRVVPITVCRQGRRIGLELQVGRRPAPLGRVLAAVRWRGLVLEDLSADHRERLELPESTAGVLIIAVRPDSPADKAGLKADQVIQYVGPHRIAELGDFVDFAERWRGQMPLGVLGAEALVLMAEE